MKIKIIGRYSINNNHYIFYNGGSGLSFKMKGASFKVDLANIGDLGSFRVFVDKNFDCFEKKYLYTFLEDGDVPIDNNMHSINQYIRN